MSEGGGENEELDLEPMDIDPPPLIADSQDALLKTYTDYLMEDTNIVPFVALYEDPQNPRRLCKNVVKNGPASCALFAIARELCLESSLSVKRCASIVCMHMSSPEFRSATKRYPDKAYDTFISMLDMFVSQSKHPFMFIIYQDPNGLLCTHLQAEEHVHKYAFWHGFVSNIGDDTNSLNLEAFSSQLAEEEPAEKEVEIDEDFEELDFVVDDEAPPAFDAISCKDVIDSLKAELNKMVA